MQLAAILSDLTSLRVCDHAAALALVSARPPPPSNEPKPLAPTSPPPANAMQPTDPTDPDLTRAHTLLHLHQTVKLAYTAPSYSSSSSSSNRSSPPAAAALHAARQSVARALAILDAGEARESSKGYRGHTVPKIDVEKAEAEAEMDADYHDEDDEEVNAWS